MTDLNYDKIEVLDEITHIRKRASMYIGETKSPLHLLQELIDNAVDELAAGAKSLNIRIFEDNSFEVQDDGRGFPHRINETEKVPDAIVAFIKLHSGAKFGSSAYSSSIGLHGVGLTVVNALCKKVEVETVRDNKVLRFTLSDGKLVGSWTIEDVKEQSISKGTRIRAWPDEKYFETVKIDSSKIKEKLQVVKLFSDESRIFFYHNGKEEEIESIPIEKVVGETETDVYEISVEDPEKKEKIRVLFGYGKGFEKEARGAVNLLSCSRGLHIRIFEKALQNAWIECAEEVKRSLQPQDFLVGYRCFVSITLRETSFSSQTKEYLLGSVEDHKGLLDKLQQGFKIWIDSLPSEVFSALLNKFRSYRESVEKSTVEKLVDSTIRTPKERKKQIGSKLVDCTSQNPENTELFICEGDSAGGTFLKIRDPRIHAILPLRGKILNVASQNSLERSLTNKEIHSMISSFGTGIGNKFDISRLRYEKIIITTDPDVDGAQIRALILGAISTLVPDLIEAGVVYLLQVPLFGIVDKGQFIPIFDKEEFLAIKDQKVKKKRMKGLGSFDPESLRTIALDKQKRRLVRVTPEGLSEALNIVGSSTSRKKFLIDYGLISNRQENGDQR